jgi:hypothetical protein
MTESASSTAYRFDTHLMVYGMYVSQASLSVIIDDKQEVYTIPLMILGILGSRPEEYGLNENGWVGRYFRILDFEYSKILDDPCREDLIIFAYDDDEQ